MNDPPFWTVLPLPFHIDYNKFFKDIVGEKLFTEMKIKGMRYVKVFFSSMKRTQPSLSNRSVCHSFFFRFFTHFTYVRIRRLDQAYICHEI